MKKIHIDEVKRRLRVQGRGIEIDESTYRVISDKAWFICSHGHKWDAITTNVVGIGHGCPHCRKANCSAKWKEVHARPEVKAKHKASIKAALNRPEIKARQKAGAKAACSRPEERARKSAASKEVASRPEVKAKKSAAMKVVLDSPEARAKMSARAKVALNRPETKARQKAGIKAALNHPDAKAKLRENGGWHHVKWYRERGYDLIYLYLIEFIFNGDRHCKTGISCNPKNRWYQLERAGCTNIQLLCKPIEGTPEYICKREREIMRASRTYHSGLPKSFDGHSECFTRLIAPEIIF